MTQILGMAVAVAFIVAWFYRDMLALKLSVPLLWVLVKVNPLMGGRLTNVTIAYTQWLAGFIAGGSDDGR